MTDISFFERVNFHGAPLEVCIEATVYLGNFFAPDDPDMVGELTVFLLNTDEDVTDQLLEDDLINLEISAMQRARERRGNEDPYYD